MQNPTIEPRKFRWIQVGIVLQSACLLGGIIASWLKLPWLGVVLPLLGATAFILSLLFGLGLITQLKLSLRDLFWITLVAAIAVGWYAERRPLDQEMKSSSGYQRFYFPNTMPSASAQRRAALLKEMSSLSENALKLRMQNAVNWWGDDEFNCCLTELSRRGLTDAVRHQHDIMYEKSLAQFGGFETWAALTALRRCQNRLDPLRVHIQVPENSPRNRHTKPLLILTVENVDVEGQPVVFTEMGTQNHGREEYARVFLTTESGQPVPESNFDLIHPMLDFYPKVRYSSRLAKGNKNAVPLILDMRKYLAPPTTGRYWLQVAFSDSFIADQTDLNGYTICYSDRIPVWVESRVAPVQHRFHAAYAVLIVLLLVTAVIGWSFFERLRRQLSDGEKTVSMHRLIEWRASIALIIALLMAWGWLSDVQHLASEIERLRPHDDADWSITLRE